MVGSVPVRLSPLGSPEAGSALGVPAIFSGVSYAPRGRLVLGGFMGADDSIDSIDSNEFLRLLYDSDDLTTMRGSSKSS